MPEGSFTLNDTDAALWAREQERETLRFLQGNFSASASYLRALLRSNDLYVAWKRKYLLLIEYWLGFYSDLNEKVGGRLQSVADTNRHYRIDAGIAFFGQMRESLEKGAAERNIRTSKTYSLEDAPEHLRDDVSQAISQQNDHLLGIIGTTTQNLQRIQSGEPIEDSPTRPPPGITPPVDPAIRPRSRTSRILHNVGTHIWDHKGEIATGMVAGAGVRIAFAAAATILTLPAAPVIFIGGIAAGMASSYAKALVRSRKSGNKVTRKEALLEAFKGAAFAFGGEIVGMAVTSLIPADFFQRMHENIQQTFFAKPYVPNLVHPSQITPVASTSLFAEPPSMTPDLLTSNSLTPNLSASDLSISDTTDLHAPLVLVPAPIHETIIMQVNPTPAPTPSEFFRDEVNRRIQNSGLNRLPGDLKRRLLNALGTKGHENWRLVMARLADAGYYDFNGRGGAPHNLATRKLGASFFGLANRIADHFDITDRVARSVRKSTTWLAKLPNYAPSLS